MFMTVEVAMLEIIASSNIAEVFFLLCHILGYVAIIGSISAMVVKLVRYITHCSEKSLLAGTECKITLLCCTTFVLIGVSIVVFFNSI
ncbi:MAG: hypothetical protein RR547_02985 [Raoultibacter sp.]